jgi:hypothetical protein
VKVQTTKGTHCKWAALVHGSFNEPLGMLTAWCGSALSHSLPLIPLTSDLIAGASAILICNAFRYICLDMPNLSPLCSFLLYIATNISKSLLLYTPPTLILCSVLSLAFYIFTRYFTIISVLLFLFFFKNFTSLLVITLLLYTPPIPI